MSNIIKRHIFDFGGYAKELQEFISTYYLPKNHSVPPKVIRKELETLLVRLARYTVYYNTNQIVPNEQDDDEDAYVCFGITVGIDPIKMNELMMDCALLDKVLDDVHELVKGKPWHLFVVRRGMIEDFGDWRILEWEREHLTENGKYVKSKNID